MPSVVEVRRNPVPGGGFVLIYADIRAFPKDAEDFAGFASASFTISAP